MTVYYCHTCAISQGHVTPVDPVALSGNEEQLDKFLKHTTPSQVYPGKNGVFNDPTYGNYEGYVVSGLSGCLEIDNQNRKNMIWVGCQSPGVTLVNGEFHVYGNAVKVVLPEDEAHIHAFPVFEPDLETQRCANCNDRVVTAR